MTIYRHVGCCKTSGGSREPTRRTRRELVGSGVGVWRVGLEVGHPVGAVEAGERWRRVQLTVSGRGVEVDVEAVERLSTGTPEVRRWWTATTEDYEPVVLLELSGGLLLVTGRGVGADRVRALRWQEMAGLARDEQAWTLLVRPVGGATFRLLFASVGELRSVAAHLAERLADAGHGERSMDETRGEIGSEPTAGSVAEAATEDPARSRCSRPAHVRPAARNGRGARTAHSAGPTLDRIERRLASVETLLADLTVASRPRQS